jgi:pentatricopeptide repeat domain-containing protein 1
MCERKLQADTTTQNALVTATGRAVQWRSALFEVRKFRRWSVEPDVITRNSAAAVLRQHWRWGHLFLHQISKDSRDLLTYNTTLSGSGPGAIWRLSFAVLDELFCDGLLADPFSFSANNACEANGEWQQTQYLLQRLPTTQIRMNVVAFNSTVSTLDKSSEWQSAQFLLYVLRSKLTQAETTTFNAATSACQKSGKWQNAQAMLAELRARDIPSDVITYSSVISATEEGSQWRQVQSLMCEVQDVSYYANLVVYNAAISACARAGRTRLAISFYQNLQKEQLEADAITYESLLSALHQGAQFQSILYFLQVVSNDNMLQLQAFTAAQGKQVLYAAMGLMCFGS